MSWKEEVYLPSASTILLYPCPSELGWNLAQVPPGWYLDLAPHLTLMESLEPLRYYFHTFQRPPRFGIWWVLFTFHSQAHRGFSYYAGKNYSRILLAFMNLLTKSRHQSLFSCVVSWIQGPISSSTRTLSQRFAPTNQEWAYGFSSNGGTKYLCPLLKDREQDVLVLFWKNDFYVYLLS